MAKKSFNDIKRPLKTEKDKILMKVYTPVVEKKPSSTVSDLPFGTPRRIDQEINTIPKINPLLERRKNETRDTPFIDSNFENTPNKHKPLIWIVALGSVVFLFFALSFIFSKATVTVVPKIKSISLNENMSALKNPSVDDLSFDLMTLSDEESKTVTAGEEKDVKDNARGKIVLYNDFSTSPQQLLVDTRLEGSNGKIYKTKTKTVIPGKGKDGTPGKVSVDIYANEPGLEYNSTPIDFKIFGFKNSSKYPKFYGRSVGDITGGFIGKSKQISDVEKTKIEDELKTSLQAKLFNKALGQIPQGFILYKDATLFSTTDLSVSEPTADGSLVFNMKANLSGFVLNEKKLTDKIIAVILPDEKSDDLYISNLKDMTFTLSGKDSIDFKNASKIDFGIYGVPKAVYKVDDSKLAADLAGKSKNDFKQILSGYLSIDSAELSIKPIWKSTFPDKIDHIKVIVNYPK